jgi:hypothetical protein
LLIELFFESFVLLAGLAEFPFGFLEFSLNFLIFLIFLLCISLEGLDSLLEGDIGEL